jgi:hypothetical protein
MKTQTVELEQILKIWKDLKIDHCTMNFSCGGDSMNDFSFEFFDENENVLHSDELDKFFEEEVFDRVDFYVNSDGHYLGEFGTVHIELNEEENNFEYSKSGSSEYSESTTENFDYQLTDEEFILLRDKISDINGGESWNTNVNYKTDCIINDDESNILEELENKINNFICSVDFENGLGELQDESDSFEFIVENDLNEENKTISVSITRSYYVVISE